MCVCEWLRNQVDYGFIELCFHVTPKVRLPLDGKTVAQMYRSFSLSRNKKINRKPSSGKSQEFVML